MAETSDAGEDGIGRFCPDEGLRVGVSLSDVGVDRIFEIGGLLEGTALQASTGQQGKPALDEIEPRRGCRREVKVPARTLHDPVVDQLGFVDGRVVEHEVYVEIIWYGRLNLIEEGAELDRTMPAWMSSAANRSLVPWQ